MVEEYLENWKRICDPIEECPDNCQEFDLYQESDRLLMMQIENDEREETHRK